MEMKHLSTIANDVVRTCARKLDCSVSSLVEEFDREWDPRVTSGYSRKLVESCCSRALTVACSTIGDTILDGSFSRFTFDMMLAWETPSSQDEKSHSECMSKEKEEKAAPTAADDNLDDVSIFYSDMMPLLVDREPSAGEDAFVWLGSLVPLVVEVVSGRFTFETLTAPTGNRLHFPAYDKFLKEIHGCIKHLRKQEIPTGADLAADEFILHVEGTPNSQRVVRHIGGASWPGRLTLTNYALYFEASGIISYEDAIKLDLSKDVEQTVKSAATGPWGAPLFDKAIVYESPELKEGVIIEFPEMTSSTRRDHWLALVKEIMLLHKFLSTSKLESNSQVWEMHSRTILGILRLHSAREMLRISPPLPQSFLIFTLLEGLPKGDYVLEEFAESLKKFSGEHPCSASSILGTLNGSWKLPCAPPCLEAKEDGDVGESVQPENLSLLESKIDQVREEAKEMDEAKSSAERLKDEGISESAQVLMGLLEPFQTLVPISQGIFTWERPVITFLVMVSTIIVIYKEWVGLVISSFLLWVVSKMMWARRTRVLEKHNKIVIFTGSDQSAVESIVSAHQGLRSAHDMLKETNIALLKIWSIMVSKAPKHTNTVMIILTCTAITLAVVPFKYILIGLDIYGFTMTSELGKLMQSEQSDRRLREWWDSIPVIPVEFVDNVDTKESSISKLIEKDGTFFDAKQIE